MSNAVGLRDQRLRIYAASDVGMDGITRTVYTYTRTWWARLDESSATVRAMAVQLAMQLDAVAQFADEAVVPVASVLKDPSGTMWWVRGINPIRATRRINVGLERVSMEQVATFVLYEGESTLDGVHLIDPE